MLNKVIIIGRLTRDVELRYSPQGAAVAKFTVACDRYGSEGADFIPVTTFKQSAEACANNIGKGSLVAVEGRWQTGSYENNDGKRVYTNDLIASNVRFLSRKDSEQQSNPSPNAQNDPFKDDGREINISDNDLPF